MPDRLTREEAAKFIGCGITTFDKLQREGKLKGTYMQIYSRRFYFTDKLIKWMEGGGTNGKTD